MSDAPKTTTKKTKVHGGQSSRNKVNFICALRKLYHSILIASTLSGGIPMPS
jgi:hypothetical protein